MINKEEFEKASFEENQKFIKNILRLATHNAFTKDDLLLLIKWQNSIIERMKCCENCKYHSFWGDELKCNYGMKEALQEDKLVECEDMDKWELAE